MVIKSNPEIKCGNCSYFITDETGTELVLQGRCVENIVAKYVYRVTSDTDPRTLTQLKAYIEDSGQICFKSNRR